MPVMTPRTSYNWELVPLPLAGASGDRSARPSSSSPVRPCTSPIDSTLVACTESVQVAVSPSSSVAVTVTA